MNTRSYSTVAMDVSVSFGKHVCTQCCACPWECNCQAMVYVTDMLGTCRFCPVASKLVRPTPALAGSVEGTVINTDITDNHSSQSWSPFCRMLRPWTKDYSCGLLPLLWGDLWSWARCHPVTVLSTGLTEVRVAFSVLFSTLTMARASLARSDEFSPESLQLSIDD